MKKKLTLSFLFFLSLASFAQKPLPIIKANSQKAYIMNGNEERYNWILSPELKIDVHTLSKSTKPRRITLYTDIDSISVKLKAGQHYDFIVLLNESDTCYTRFESAPYTNFARQKPEIHDTIPFSLGSENAILIKAVLNQRDTLTLAFDSGTTGLLLTRQAIKKKTHLGADWEASNALQIGKQTWTNLEVYDVELSGHGSDGRFGWDLFDGRVVEIDYDNKRFIVHSKRPEIGRGYSALKMEYVYGLFCIPGTLNVKGQHYTNRFLFDTGYERTVMLDTAIMREQNYPTDLPTITKTSMKNGRGEDVPIVTVFNDQLILGTDSLQNVPVQLMQQANPAGFKTNILGNEVLKRFNIVLDFQKNRVFLKPNSKYRDGFSVVIGTIPPYCEYW